MEYYSSIKINEFMKLIELDRIRKYNPEGGNSDTKEHTQYALTDEWILAQKLRITKIQFTDHMKLKKKKDQITQSRKCRNKLWSRD